MKKILALTLALMLALSLTAALAAKQGENTLDLQVNVDTQTVNNVTVTETWNVDISATTLSWNVIQKKTLTGSVSEWHPDTGKYTDNQVTSNISESTLAESDVKYKPFRITNNSNFDVSYTCVLSPSSAAFAGALFLEGDPSSGTLANKGGAINSNSARVAVGLNAEKLGEVSTGSAGSITVTLSKSGDVYPYEP